MVLICFDGYFEWQGPSSNPLDRLGSAHGEHGTTPVIPGFNASLTLHDYDDSHVSFVIFDHKSYGNGSFSGDSRLSLQKKRYKKTSTTFNLRG